jgi:hypothetical protein
MPTFGKPRILLTVQGIGYSLFLRKRTTSWHM